MAGFDSAETRRFLEADPWASRLGITVGDVTTTELCLTLELTEDHLNFLDGGHGGAVFSLAETAVAVAAGHRGGSPETIDAHLALTAGAEEADVLTAMVKEVAAGRTLGTYRVTITRSDGRVAGVMTATTRLHP
ncbi:hydroxyphenylacetyl-CoA thioesterase PaaI [soil metagenome]